MSETDTAEPTAGPTPTRVSRVGWLVTQGGKKIGRAASKAEAEAIGHAWAQTEADRLGRTAILEVEDADGDVERTRKFKPQG